MLIVCPACASEYEIDAARVGPEGRSVRCAACRETWFVMQDAEPAPEMPGAAGDAPDWEAAPAEDSPREASRKEAGSEAGSEADVLDHPAPPPRRAKAPQRPRRKPSTWKPSTWKPSTWKPAIWKKPSPAIAAGLVVFVLLPLGLLGRSTVVRAMPQSAAVFSAIGLPVNLRGVAFRDVVAFRNPAEGGNPAQLVVEGDLVGVARERVAVAPLEIEVRDAHDVPVYRWTVAAPRAALEPGETARFSASLSAPPVQGSGVQVRFSEGKAAEAQSEVGPHEAGTDHPAAPSHPPSGH